MKIVIGIFICIHTTIAVYSQIPHLSTYSEHSKTSLQVAHPLRYSVIFQEEDTVYDLLGATAPSKGQHDCVALLPSSKKDTFQLYISHELDIKNTQLGDGGGATTIPITYSSNTWKKVNNGQSIDFSPVSYTINNCGCKLLSNGLILSAEEIFPTSNSDISHAIREEILADSNAFKKYGWMVEVDPSAKKATKKITGMGRFIHEDVLEMPDHKTYYLTNDEAPGVFFKYLVHDPSNINNGTLFAFKQPKEDHKGTWIQLPSDSLSLLNIKDIALSKGASIFLRHEWIALHNGKVYISETGKDEKDLSPEIHKGATLPWYLVKRTKNNIVKDPRGRILVYDAVMETIKPWLEGGVDNALNIDFTNPDCIHVAEIHGTNYLLISEDRVSKPTTDQITSTNNELFAVDLSIKNPTLSNLKRIAIGPDGCETTGIFWSKTYKSLFVNIQHPSPKNPVPFNKSSTIVITGF